MRFPELKNVVNSVTSNGTQLAMTALLPLIIIYIYTTVSFFYLQDTLYDYNINPYDSDIVGENRCVSMIQCYMTVLDRGLVLGGGIGDYTEQLHYLDATQKYGLKLFHDSTFHLAVKVVLMNILFGIIIDTFATMREANKYMRNDSANNCFICNEERLKFE